MKCKVIILFIIASIHISEAARCANLKTVESFDLEAFSGTWYESESYGNLWERISSICPKVVYDVDTNSGLITVNNTGKARLIGRQMSFAGAAVVAGSGKLNVSYTLPVIGERMAPHWIVGTDYTNWAIIWSCTEKFFSFGDSSWILMREHFKTIPNKFNDEINPVLKSAGLQRSWYHSIDQSECEI